MFDVASNRLTVRTMPLVFFSVWMFVAGVFLGNAAAALFITHRHLGALNIIAIPLAGGVAYALIRMWRRMFRLPEFSADQRRVFMGAGFSAAVVFIVGLCGLLGGLWFGVASGFNDRAHVPVRARELSQER